MNPTNRSNEHRRWLERRWSNVPWTKTRDSIREILRRWSAAAIGQVLVEQAEQLTERIDHLLIWTESRFRDDGPSGAPQQYLTRMRAHVARVDGDPIEWLGLIHQSANGVSSTLEEVNRRMLSVVSGTMKRTQRKKSIHQLHAQESLDAILGSVGALGPFLRDFRQDIGPETLVVLYTLEPDYRNKDGGYRNGCALVRRIRELAEQLGRELCATDVGWEDVPEASFVRRFWNACCGDEQGQPHFSTLSETTLRKNQRIHDCVLVDAAVAGCNQAAAEVMRQIRDMSEKICRRRQISVLDRDGVISDLYQRLLTWKAVAPSRPGIDAFQGRSRLRYWLAPIIKHQFLATAKREKCRNWDTQTGRIEDVEAHDSHVDEESVQRIVEFLRGFDQKELAVFSAMFIDERTDQDIATLFGTNRAQPGRWRIRMIEKLRRQGPDFADCLRSIRLRDAFEIATRLRSTAREAP